jgi:hypothetical protein
MKKFRLGERIWVATPKKVEERKVGTIMAIEKSVKGSRYTIEWETDLEDGKRPKYLSHEIVSLNPE